MAMTQNQPQTTIISAPGFVEVKQSEPEEAPSQPTGQISIEVIGCKISADSGYPPEALATLLKALTQPC